MADTTTRHLLIPGPQDAKVCDGCTCVCPFGWDAHGDRDAECLAAERAAREQTEEMARLRARVAELEAPPVVPEGFVVRKDNGSVLDGFTVKWVCDWDGDTDTDQIPAVVLRVLAWAIEHDTRPPHAGDGE